MACAAAVCFAPAAPARAEGPSIEIGTSLLGLSVTGYSGLTTTFVGIPATLYGSFFATPRLVLEPQVGFHSMNAGSHSDRLLLGTFQVAYLLRDPRRHSPYLVVDLTAAKNSYTADETNLALGAGAGYRVPMGVLAARVELKYRRYVRPGADALSVIVAVGYVR
jgi:hypothetical protein